MTYPECLAYLERLGNEVLTMKFGLESIRSLCIALGGIHRKFPSVLIAGTNGKGSTARFLAAAATGCGIRAGLYTSPHLVRVTERMQMDGIEISTEEFADCFGPVAAVARSAAVPCHPTFFEMVTATAFLFFARREVELAVLEVGMGGRLDSTNVVEPWVSVITPIGLDHQQYLGETLALIAGEKAGVLRPEKPAWSAAQREEAGSVLLERARKLNAQLRFLTGGEAEEVTQEDGLARFRLQGIPYRLTTPGACQVQNAVLATQALKELGKSGLDVDLSAAAGAMGEVRVPGVLQRMAGDPPVYLDGGHNLDAAQQLAEFVGSVLPRPRHLVFGIMSDKDWTGVLRRLQPCFDRIYLTRAPSVRAADPSIIQRTACPEGIVVEEPVAALKRARRAAGSVVVAGSFYLVGAILAAAEAQSSL